MDFVYIIDFNLKWIRIDFNLQIRFIVFSYFTRKYVLWP